MNLKASIQQLTRYRGSGRGGVAVRGKSDSADAWEKCKYLIGILIMWPLEGQAG